MQRKNREIVIFNLSAIDLFCSGMGAVMVLMVLLMPYYRKQKPPEPEPALVAATRPEVPEPEPVPIPSPPEPVPEPSVLIHDLELMIVIDTTASMGGAIDDLRTTLGTIVNVLSRLTKNLKVGVVAYRDHGDEYLVRGFPLRQLEPAGAGLAALREFLLGLKAGGGGDVPEAVVEAVQEATLASAGWVAVDELPERSRQVILIVADAQGHDHKASKSSAIASEWQADDVRRGVYCAVPPVSSSYFEPLATAGKGRLVTWSDMLGAILDVVVDKR